MSRIVDEDPPIKTHPASKEYRDNWDRIFGEKKDEPSEPTIDMPYHLDNTGLRCRNSQRAVEESVLNDHDCCYTCNEAGGTR